MLIGEICRETELSKDTIRFYEKKGLLTVERTVSPFNDYKNYTAAHLNRLQLIKKAKRFGFTLNQISELLDLFDRDSANCKVLQKKVSEKITDIDAKIQELQEIKKLILIGVEESQTDCRYQVEDQNCKLLES